MYRIQFASRDFRAALFVDDRFGEPDLSKFFASKNIPASNSQFRVKQNWTRTRIPAVDTLLLAADTELADSKRAEDLKKAEALLAEAAASLPIAPVPDILVWNGKTVTGPVSNNPLMGPFWNLNQLGVSR